MAVFICTVCDTPYDEDKEGVKWEDLPAALKRLFGHDGPAMLEMITDAELI